MGLPPGRKGGIGGSPDFCRPIVLLAGTDVGQQDPADDEQPDDSVHDPDVGRPSALGHGQLGVTDPQYPLPPTAGQNIAC